MRVRLQRTSVALLCSALLVVVGSGWGLQAQQPTAAAAKKPLSYDTYDYWRSIQGTTLSRDGEWLAYALTAQGADGELVVRNLRTGAETKQPRGTSPAFTADSKYVVFTIVQSKADEERERQAQRTQGRGQAQTEGEPGAAGGAGGAARNQPRNSAGILTLATGQVATVDRIGSISLPEESSTWVALHRGNGGAGRGGRGGRGAAAGRGGPPAAPAAAGRGQAAAGEGGGREATPRAKRKDAGSDLIVRNLTTGQDVTIPLVTDFAWSKDGGVARRTRCRRRRPKKTARSCVR